MPINATAKIHYKSSVKPEECLHAWSRGLRKLGVSHLSDSSLMFFRGSQNLVNIIFGSWKDRNIQHHQVKNKVVSSGRPFIVNETSLLGRQKVSDTFDENWFRIGVNGFLADTGLFNNKNSPVDRWEKISAAINIKLLPWSVSGDYILLALQLPGDASLRGRDISEWALQACRKIRQKSDFPIVIRKPQLDREFDKSKINACLDLPNVTLQNGTRENLFETIDKSLFTYTYTSGLGIDSILRGKPVVVDNTGSFVYPIRTCLEEALSYNFTIPDRTQLLSDLAYAQWSLDEIAQGFPWLHLLPVIESLLSKKLNS